MALVSCRNFKRNSPAVDFYDRNDDLNSCSCEARSQMINANVNSD